MKDEELDQLFRSLDFDVASPPEDHRKRFREKLEAGPKGKLRRSGVLSLWLPVASIAASFLLGFFLLQTVFSLPAGQQGELGSVSTEMEDTQQFYASVIKQELARLEEVKSPETEQLVQDALGQLDKLEQDYQRLKTDLVKSGNDRRVIHAMISNFQQRIDLLNQVLEKANTINDLKTPSHENHYL